MKMFEITSGYEYRAYNKDKLSTVFGITPEGVLFMNTYNGAPESIAEWEVKSWISVTCTYEPLALIDGNVYYGELVKHGDKTYGMSDALELLYCDEYAFETWVNDNVDTVTIAGYDFTVDYDTMCEWGIRDVIFEQWANTLEQKILDGEIDGWERVAYDPYITPDNVTYCILPSGHVIPKDAINADNLSAILDTVMEDNTGYIGNWRVENCEPRY